MYISDLHIHSRFSRATSKDCDIPHLDWWARRKGIQVLGTGDFTHPAWRAEMKEQLVPAEEGVYTLRKDLCLSDAFDNEPPRFVVTGEISSIYKRDGKTRKVHNLIILPSLEAADALSAKLETIGNLHSDGRPILGLDSHDLIELTLETCPDAEFIPAHIWTPHFSMFGAFSGFETIEACFDDMAPYIHAIETGLSSDPPMNWRVPALDGLTLISNSDAHSPAKLGREANLLETGYSYHELIHAIRTGEGFIGTVEFFPEEGKYHLDGHRNCGVCLTPGETRLHDGLCPVCGRKLTIGVEHRVEELSARTADFRPENAKHFECLAPLPEVIASSTGNSLAGKKTAELYEQMLQRIGTEFYILRDAPLEDLERAAGPCVAEGIRRLRSGAVNRKAGFDGQYGTISLLSSAEIKQLSGQISLLDDIEIAEEIAEIVPCSVYKKMPAALHEPAAAPSPSDGDMLNQEQQTAVTYNGRTAAVIAGPGTGKTKTLVARIAYLVEELKVKPEEITAVTFTNQAAAEMRRRLEKRLGGKRAAARMTIGTFHAICLNLLGDVHLISAVEALTIADEILSVNSNKKNAKGLLQAVSRVKNGASFESAGINEDMYAAYCTELQKMNVLDFDDLLIEALKLDTFERRNFTHLLVDEFQDINEIQYALIQLWSIGSKSLFVIGDPDQSIYGFRGATARCFQRLIEDQPETQKIQLLKNYRSTPEIIHAAIPIIEKNPGTPRVLLPNRGAGTAVRLIRAADSFAEGIFIAKEIGRMTGGIDMIEAQRNGCERDIRAFSDIAVLCRTHRQIELIEKCLRHDDIPCVISGREDFLDTDEVRGVLAFFRSLQTPADAASLKTALRLLWRCPAEWIQKIQAACEKQTELEPAALQETVHGFPPLESWLKRAEEWLPFVKKEKPIKLIARWADSYGNNSPALEQLKNMAVFYSNLQGLWNALNLGQEADLRRAAGKGWESGAVRLMTFHGSKGLEFPAVFASGLKAGILPLESQGRPADVEEERRLLYVGMTRACEELILTTIPEPSPFLRDLPCSVVRESTIREEQIVEQLSLF